MFKCSALMLGLAVTGFASAAEPVDLDMANRIRQQAFHHSQVMDIASHLTVDIGARLSNSPQMAAAIDWTQGKFKAWGLSNVHAEPFADFGRGWEFRDASVVMLSPRQMPLHALPEAWTPGTHGAVEGEVMQVKIEDKDDLKQYEGKLKGKIVLLDEARAYERSDKPDSQRDSAQDLRDMQAFEVPAEAGDQREKWLGRYLKRKELTKAINTFFAEQGVLATLSISSRDDGIIRATGGGSRKAGEPVGVPSLVMMAEHYNDLTRLLAEKQPVKLKINVDARFTSDSNQSGYNTVAEIPGSGRSADEVVMLGAHMDSWHTGTGAADNAAGVAVMMEAMRILKTIGVKPKRTIRVALWDGEEQGLIGSNAYVAEHFGHYPEPTDPAQKALPAFFRKPTGALQKTAEYDRLAAYFNLDNGSGRIRGIYAQENLAAAPIFASWLQPFHDVGATTVTSRNTGSTDHIAFDRIGLPGFQFIQDDLDYFSHVHHTHLDTYDHLEAADLKQAAAIVAWFAWNAANRAERLPRKPLLQTD